MPTYLTKPFCPYADKTSAEAWIQGFNRLPLTTPTREPGKYSDDVRMAYSEGAACRTIAIAQAAQKYATAPDLDTSLAIYAQGVELYGQNELDKAIWACPVGLVHVPSDPPGPANVGMGAFPKAAPWQQVWTAEQFAAAKATARQAAMQYGAPYTYTPKNEREAATWEPHGWVLKAMQSAWLGGLEAGKPKEPVKPHPWRDALSAWIDNVDLKLWAWHQRQQMGELKEFDWHQVDPRVISSVYAKMAYPACASRAKPTHVPDRSWSIKDDTSDSLPPAPAQTPFDVDDSDDAPAPVITLKIGHVSAAAHKSTHTLDRTIAAALREAKQADMPQGLIVAMLQAHLQRETQTMLDS